MKDDVAEHSFELAPVWDWYNESWDLHWRDRFQRAMAEAEGRITNPRLAAERTGGRLPALEEIARLVKEQLGDNGHFYDCWTCGQSANYYSPEVVAERCDCNAQKILIELKKLQKFEENVE